MTRRTKPAEPIVTPRSSSWAPAAIFLIVVAVTAAYSNSFSGAFVFDDIRNIENNMSIRSLRSSLALRSPGGDFLPQRPLTTLSFAVDYAIDGLNVQAYHATNLLIHLLAALALFGIVRRTLLLPALQQKFGRASTGLATAVALIWALHPLQTESVTYIVQRAESLMGLCFLLTLYCALRSATSARPWPWRAAAVIACALGMGAKEVMVAAPIVVLLYDRAFLSGSYRETFRRRGALYVGLAATWAVLIAFLHAPAAAGFGLKSVTPWRYLITQPGVILQYLKLCFWPAPLCLDYAWPFAAKLWTWPIAPEAFAIVALLAATVWAVIRRPALGFLGGWFFLILGPTSSFMPIEDACYEHRMYLSLAAVVAGAVLAAHWLIRRLARKWDWPDKSATIAAAALVMAASVAFGCVTFRRNVDYRTEMSLWEDASAKRPDNARVWANLGACYLMANRFDDALRCYNRAIELKLTDCYYNRGLVLSKLNDHAGAIRDFTEAIASNPDFPDSYIHRGDEYFLTQRFSDAIQDFTKAISLEPDNARVWSNLGACYMTQGRVDDALRCYDRAVELKQPDALYNRGMALAKKKDHAGAIRDLSAYLALKPDFVNAYINRGLEYSQTGRLSEAIADYTKAISLRPDSAALFFNRASACMALGQCEQALSDLNRAIDLQPGFVMAWDARAKAHFMLKDYDDAWRDVAAFQRLGGKPDADFVQALKQASGRSE